MPRFTIQDVEFTAPEKYKAGHVCSAGEADALNKTLQSVTRKKFASQVASTLDPQNLDIEVFEKTQTEVTNFFSSHSFDTVYRSVEKQTPLEIKTRSLAREILRKQIHEQGKRMADYHPAQINEAIDKYLAQHPELAEQAEEELKLEQARAKTTLDDLDL